MLAVFDDSQPFGLDCRHVIVYFFRICPDTLQASWLSCICDCLIQCGIPKEIVCDTNLYLVISSKADKRLRFNPDFEWFCEFFGINSGAFSLIRPHNKGSLERAGRYVKENGLRWGKLNYPDIQSIDELDRAIQEWVKTYADVQRKFTAVLHGVEQSYTVEELFAYEKKFLTMVENSELTITYEMLTADSLGVIHINATAIQLPAKYQGNDICIAITSKGTYRVSNPYGDLVLQGQIS